MQDFYRTGFLPGYSYQISLFAGCLLWTGEKLFFRIVILLLVNRTAKVVCECVFPVVTIVVCPFLCRISTGLDFYRATPIKFLYSQDVFSGLVRNCSLE